MAGPERPVCRPVRCRGVAACPVSRVCRSCWRASWPRPVAGAASEGSIAGGRRSWSSARRAVRAVATACFAVRRHRPAHRPAVPRASPPRASHRRRPAAKGRCRGALPCRSRRCPSVRSADRSAADRRVLPIGVGRKGLPGRMVAVPSCATAGCRGPVRPPVVAASGRRRATPRRERRRCVTRGPVRAAATAPWHGRAGGH